MKLLALLLLIPVIGYASPQGVPVFSNATCGTSPGTLLAANRNRGYLLIQNQGSDTSGHCYIKPGSAVVSTDGVWVDSGQNYETIEAYTKQAWYCRCDNSGQTFAIIETNW